MPWGLHSNSAQIVYVQKKIKSDFLYALLWKKRSVKLSHSSSRRKQTRTPPLWKYCREEVKSGRRKNILWFEQGASLCTSTWGDVLSYIPLVPASIQDTQPESHRWQGAGENEWGTEWRSREEEERRWRRSWGNLKVFCYRSVNINSNRSDLWCFRFEQNRRQCLLRPCWNSLEEMRERHKNYDSINPSFAIIFFFLNNHRCVTANICTVYMTLGAMTCSSTLKLRILLYNPRGCGNEPQTNIHGKTRIDRTGWFGVWFHNQTTTLMALK